MDKKLLEDFGKSLMQNVRDYAAEEYLKMKSGQMKSERSKEMTKAINSFNQDQIEKLDFVVGRMIDNVIHKVLFNFETSDNFTIAAKENIDEVHDIVAYSDGICGELYLEDGWYQMFSKNLLNVQW